MRFDNTTILNAVDASQATQTSSAVYAAYMMQASVQVVATGAPVGTLKLQASNDFSSPTSGNVVTNWTDIPSATVSVSAAGTFLIPKTDICYQYIRAVYTKTSGTGTITAVLKSLGA